MHRSQTAAPGLRLAELIASFFAKHTLASRNPAT